LHDGSKIILKKIDDKVYDVSDRPKASKLLTENNFSGHLVTGLFYCEPNKKDSEKPLVDFTDEELRPSRDDFEKIMNGF